MKCFRDLFKKKKIKTSSSSRRWTVKWFGTNFKPLVTWYPGDVATETQMWAVLFLQLFNYSCPQFSGWAVLIANFVFRYFILLIKMYFRMCSLKDILGRNNSIPCNINFMFLSPFEDILSLLFRDREGGRIEGEIDDRYIERERGRERERERETSM